ncbi:MAG: ATP-binding protein [Thermodesulfobacteriota bacterium]
MVSLPESASLASENTVDKLFVRQLLWMLFLRVLLYTFLLGVSTYLQSIQSKVLVLPHTPLLVFITFVYLISIGSGLALLKTDLNTQRFARIQTLLDILLVSILIYFTGGSGSIFSPVYFFPIIAGGLLIPRNGGLFAAGTSTILYGLVLASEYYQYVPDFINIPHGNADSYTLLNLFAVYGLIFFLVATLSSLFAGRLRKTEAVLSATSFNFDRLNLLYKQIFDDIGTGIITTDDRSRITSANKAASHITGYSIDDLLDANLPDLFPEIIINNPNAHRFSASIHRKDGSSTRIGYSYARLQYSDPRPERNKKKKITTEISCDKCKVITLQDISEVERLEKQVQQAEKLAAIGQMSAGIAHDFRNPLTAISGSAQLLANEFSLRPTPENQENGELIKIVLRESKRLSITVSDFLKFARPEHAEKDWFSLKRCLDEVIEVAQADPFWPESIVLERDTDDIVDIWADQYQLFTILNHLIHNALSFCPEGREIIRITGRETGENEDGEAVAIELSIEDNGPGIIKEKREKIFEPFYTRRVDGTGLGLAIARKMVEEHQGNIIVGDSSFGGAKFILSFPLPQ